METCGYWAAEVASHISRQSSLNIPCGWSGLATALKTYRIQKESLCDFLPKGMLIFANEKMKYLFFHYINHCSKLSKALNRFRFIINWLPIT